MHVTFHFLLHEWGRKKVSEKEREKQGAVHRNSLKEGTFLSLFFIVRFKLSHTNIITHLKWWFRRMAFNNFKSLASLFLRSAALSLFEYEYLMQRLLKFFNLISLIDLTASYTVMQV